MKQTDTVVEVEAPIERCYSFVRDLVVNPKFLTIYRQLHDGKEYSGKIIDDIENRRIAVEESGIDVVTRKRHKGWTIKYDFQAVDAQNTRVSISLEYGTLAEIMSISTIKIQSINEILARVTTLLALEYA